MKCNYCKTKAAVNYQKVWTKFRIVQNGDYKQVRINSFDIEEPIEADNVHLCPSHEKAWLEGKI